MAAEIVTNIAQTIVGKAVDWIWNKVTSRSKLKFLDPEITYCFSYYDDNGNHVKLGGRKMIYSVLCCVTLSNPSSRPQALTHLGLSAIVDGKRYPMHLFDRDAEKWFSVYTVPADGACRTAWNAFIAGHGFVPGSPGMIPLQDEDTSLSFELSYLNKSGKERSIVIRLTQARMLNPRLIADN